MQELPNILLEWSAIDWTTGQRKLKREAPEDVKKLAIEHEKDFYNKTGRRCIANVNID